MVLCPLCNKVLERPLELDCTKLVCADCLVSHIQQSGQLTCPCCSSHPLITGFFRSPNTITMGIVGQLGMKCGFYETQVQACNLISHVDSRCNLHSVPLNSPTIITVGEILEKPVESAPTPTERRVVGRVIKRLLATGSGVVQVPSGSHGQPLTLLQVPASRKSSSEASQQTVLRRSHHLARV